MRYDGARVGLRTEVKNHVRTQDPLLVDRRGKRRGYYNPGRIAALRHAAVKLLLAHLQEGWWSGRRLSRFEAGTVARNSRPIVGGYKSTALRTCLQKTCQ